MILSYVETMASGCGHTVGFDAIFHDVFYTCGRFGNVAMMEGKYIRDIPTSSSTHGYSKLHYSNRARPISGREMRSIDSRCEIVLARLL